MLFDSSDDEEEREDLFPFTRQSVLSSPPSPPRSHCQQQPPFYLPPDPAATAHQLERFRQLEADVQMLKKVVLNGAKGNNENQSQWMRKETPRSPPSTDDSAPPINELRSCFDKILGTDDEPSNPLRAIASSAVASSSSSSFLSGATSRRKKGPSPTLDQVTILDITESSKELTKAPTPVRSNPLYKVKTRMLEDENKCTHAEEQQQNETKTHVRSDPRGPLGSSNVSLWEGEESEQSRREGHTEIELRSLVPHLSPSFVCSHTDCLFLLSAIRRGGCTSRGSWALHGRGGAGSRAELSLQDRLNIVEAEKKTLQQKLKKQESTIEELQSEIRGLKERMVLAKKEAKQSVACIGQKRDEIRLQFLQEETRCEKLRAQNMKLDAELEQMRSRMRGSH